MRGLTPDRFDVALLGDPADPRLAALQAELERRTEELGRLGDTFEIVINAAPSQAQRVAGACVVFGSDMGFDVSALEACLDAGLRAFPVLADLSAFVQQMPPSLHDYNGFRMGRDESAAELAGLVLEALGLQRGRRKIFISYARRDSAAIAAQLRDALGQRWYSVFLDTVSIRPGRLFQTELKEQLADSDVLLFLDSPEARNRRYVREELEFALQAGLGQIQLLWPGQQRLQRGGIPRVIALEPGDTQTLRPDTLAEVLRAVAEERTSLQRQREADIMAIIDNYAQWNGLTIRRHPGRHVDLSNGRDTARLDIAMGLPTSVELALPWSATDLPAGSRKQAVYEPSALSDETAAHLAFLSRRFPIRLLPLGRSETWPALL